MTANTRCWIANVPIDRITLEEATAGIVSTVRKRMATKPLLIMGPNAQLVTLAQRNPRFADALCAADLNVPDGISVVLASRLLGDFIPERVTGGDLMERLCAEAALHGLSIFLLGGLPSAAKLAAQKLKQKYPMLKVAGTYCPPLGFEHSQEENARIRKIITDAAPDLLFIAFGAPKQEIWMRNNCLSLPIGAAMSVGAALDTQAGLRKRAPQWTHRIGLEWLYRLLREPRRLWRRYLFGNTCFTYLVLRQKLARKRSPQIETELQNKNYDLSRAITD
jgi:N-acetylglucosaminyldiphosphoundecaprenol N-acetyl-beta-D-mannosaminyltransferase